jgi:arsenate reductase (thioredoxin)
MDKKKVLFIGMGNSVRSQMAEAFMRRHAGRSIEAFSAGLEPEPIDPMTIKVMKEIGVDMSTHYSKPVSIFKDYTDISYVITVCRNSDKFCPSFFPGTATGLHWELGDLDDVQGAEDERITRFREIRGQIQDYVLTWLHERGIAIEHGGDRPARPPDKAGMIR